MAYIVGGNFNNPTTQVYRPPTSPYRPPSGGNGAIINNAGDYPAQEADIPNWLSYFGFQPSLGAPLHNPNPSPYPGGGGGDGGGGGTGGDVTWSEGFSLGNAPSWWKGFMPSDMSNPQAGYAAMLNALLPSLSTEDQRIVAGNLARMFPDTFGSYSPEGNQSFAPATQLSTEMIRQFTSKERGQGILDALTKMMQASGKTEKDMGPGYSYLRQIASAMRDFGGASGESQTRMQYMNFLGAMDPLLGESKGQELAAFSPIASMLATPFFSAGQLQPVTKTATGYRFGQANRNLF